ncbi:MAG: hypothetical protein M3Y73_16790 [Actinomycetota bacterium]|nr:hypothetical protein [Actinomycetota bacterium]
MKITEIFSLGHDDNWGGDHRWRQDDWEYSRHRDNRDRDRGRWSDRDHRDC